MADHLAVDLGQEPVIGLVRRVAQGAQERLAVGPVEDVEQRLIDRFMIGFGTRAVLDRAPAQWRAGVRARRLSSIQPYWVFAARGVSLLPGARGSLLWDAGRCFVFIVRARCRLRRNVGGNRDHFAGTPAQAGRRWPSAPLYPRHPAYSTAPSAVGDRCREVRPGDGEVADAPPGPAEAGSPNAGPTHTRGSGRSGRLAVPHGCPASRGAIDSLTLNPRLHGLVDRRMAARPGDPLAARRDGPGDGRALGTNELRSSSG